MYQTDLDTIDWELIDFRDIISNINHMDFQPDPLRPSFRTFNTTDTKIPKGPSNNEHINILQEKRPEKAKDPKLKMNPRLVNGNSETPKS